MLMSDRKNGARIQDKDTASSSSLSSIWLVLPGPVVAYDTNEGIYHLVLCVSLPMTVAEVVDHCL